MTNHKNSSEVEFIKKEILDEIARLQDNGFHYLSVYVISMAIEFVGSFLDSKPFRARQQSKQRFSNAINNLFPPSYHRLNHNDWLYNKLRNHLAHSFMPSSWIVIASKKENPNLVHLSLKEKKTVFIAEDFYQDFESACNILFRLMESGKIKPKKIDSNMVKFGF